MKLFNQNRIQGQLRFAWPLQVLRHFWCFLKSVPTQVGFKRWLLHMTALGLLIGSAAFTVAALGLIPIKASSGHWAITNWFLKFTMLRSVSTHSIGLTVPDLSDQGLVLRGATHFERSCAVCHGNPDNRRPRVTQAMLPPPTDLPSIVRDRAPEELFYVVKHGVKFTGMPAWPVQNRDDEVWAMVAFLLELPKLDSIAYWRLAGRKSEESLDVSSQQELAKLEASTRRAIESCLPCHRADGQGRDDAFPRLAGQSREYLEQSLRAYASGTRHSGMMQPVMDGISDDQIGIIGRYYHERVPDRPSQARSPADTDAITRGKKIAHAVIPEARVPLCAECHGPRDDVHHPLYPSLAGQPADYLVSQMILFQERRRGGTEYFRLMHPVADNLTREQMHDVAFYYESLSSDSQSPSKRDAYP